MYKYVKSNEHKAAVAESLDDMKRDLKECTESYKSQHQELTDLKAELRKVKKDCSSQVVSNSNRSHPPRSQPPRSQPSRLCISFVCMTELCSTSL
jgi:hypothetical protein